MLGGLHVLCVSSVAPRTVFSVAPPTAGLNMSLMDKEQELAKVQAELEKLQPFKVSYNPCN